jgi:peroxidase
MALDVIVRLLVVAAVAGGVLAVPGRADPGAGLAIGFYNETCPRAEELVLEEMRAIVHEDRTLGPALLRLLFHDCFVRVRVLLNSSSCAHGLVAAVVEIGRLLLKLDA